MQSPIYQDWVKEERAEGIKQGIKEGKVEGRVEGKKQAILDYLDVRFGFELVDLRENIAGLTGSGIIDYLLKRIYASDTPEKAREVIEEALKAHAKAKSSMSNQLQFKQSGRHHLTMLIYLYTRSIASSIHI